MTDSEVLRAYPGLVFKGGTSLIDLGSLFMVVDDVEELNR